MIKGVGVDMVEVSRIREKIERNGERFTEKIFTPDEAAYCESGAPRFERYAARFAAKEAVLKVLGTGWGQGIGWLSVEVVHDDAGAPKVVLHGPAMERAKSMGISEIHLSLTHTAEHAIAFAVAE